MVKKLEILEVRGQAVKPLNDGNDGSSGNGTGGKVKQES